MEEYHAALLHLRMQARCFAEAFCETARAANEYDPEGTKTDPVGDRTMIEVAAHLQAACERVPGARDVFALALSAQRKDS
jgi:hypothetical protein